MKNRNIIVISGPTGSGKTELSMAIAKHYGAPIISADSRQVFRGMSIGTAQPSERQLSEIKHYLVSNKDITEHYTAGQYEKDALATLETLFQSHEIVVVVGGSGLYIDALCYGMDRLAATDFELRATLTQRLEQKGIESLLSELKELDPAFYTIVDKNNPMRVMRALEVCLQSGRPYSEQRTNVRVERYFGIIKIATELPREVLYERINSRVDNMVAAGLETEALALYPHRVLNSLQSVGYREFFEFFDGTTSHSEAIELIKRNSRRYAKRQMTWIRRDGGFALLDPHAVTQIIEYIESKLSQRLK